MPGLPSSAFSEEIAAQECFRQMNDYLRLHCQLTLDGFGLGKARRYVQRPLRLGCKCLPNFAA